MNGARLLDANYVTPELTPSEGYGVLIICIIIVFASFIINQYIDFRIQRRIDVEMLAEKLIPKPPTKENRKNPTNCPYCGSPKIGRLRPVSIVSTNNVTHRCYNCNNVF